MPGDDILPTRVRLLILFSLLLAICLAGWAELAGTCRETKARLAMESIRVESRLLSEFGGKRTFLNGAIVAPRTFTKGSKLPVMFHFPGFGENSSAGWQWAEQQRGLMDRDPSLAMVHVSMDPSIAGGYSYFTDSPNNGPWAAAFITEFIPALEQKLSSEITPGPRFLTGHSSGGWTALWLQLHAPDEFAGVWATSPDPVDFSDFYGVDLSPGSVENFYFDLHGTPRPAARSGSWGAKSLREYVAADEQDPSQRGDIASYEWAFSSRGADGAPLRLFDRASGTLNQAALRDWERFDLRKLLVRSLPASPAKLRGKIHLWAGAEDEYFLERPLERFCRAIGEAAIEGRCAVVPLRGHKNLYHPHPALYPKGLLTEILIEASGIAAGKSQ